MKYIFWVAIQLSIVDVFGLTHYVTESGAGNQNGSTWSNAAPATALQQMIDQAQAGDEIWVACGTYLVSSTGDRNLAFHMKNQVAIYGGFEGTESSVNERDPSCGSCSILSGETGGVGNADNRYHVIANGVGLNETAVLDGFIIEGANDDRAATLTEGLGGGIYNDGGYTGNFCSPTFRHCLIRNNTAQYGAGIFNSGHSGGNASPTLMDCVITNNTALIGGGGMDNFGLGGNASPKLFNCIISSNFAAYRAGGIYCWAGNNGIASPVFTNCLIAYNSAIDGGGLVTDNENSPPGSHDGNSNPELINSILYHNSATAIGPQFFVIGSATILPTYSCVDTIGQAGLHSYAGNMTNLIYSAPEWSDPINDDGLDQCWYTFDDGFQLLGTSLLRDAASIDAPANDILGLMRSSIPDIGPYEYVEQAKLVEIKPDQICLYPNPSSGLISIQLPQNNLELNGLITDLSGRVVKRLENMKQTELTQLIDKGHYWLYLFAGTTIIAVEAFRIE